MSRKIISVLVMLLVASLFATTARTVSAQTAPHICSDGVDNESVPGIAGKIVAETIAGQAERFDIYARLKHHDFPGGMLLRRPTLVLAMLWFRLRDLLP